MKKQLRRVLVLLLAFTMCFGSAITLFAADAEVTCPGSGKVHTKDNCKYTVEKVQEPLCGKDGYTLYACDTCHAHFIDDVEKALNTCSEFKFVATVEATCKTAGTLAHEECVVCGRVRLNGYVQGEGALLNGKVVAAGTEGATDVGSDKIIVKSADGKLEIKTVKGALNINITTNHVWGEWKSTADGKGQTRYCTVCNTSDASGSHTHNYVIVSVEEAPDATMDKPGKATAKCSKCDATAVVDVYPVHACKDYLTKIAKKDATCTAEGVKETYYVCKCGKAYKDAEAKTIMTAEEVAAQIIEKHDGSTVPAETKATCTTYGMIGKVCSKCGAQVGETEVIAPTGHKYLTYPADVKNSSGVVIHKKGDVIVNYTKMYNPNGGTDGKGEWVTYDAKTCKDTWKLEETRYCVNVAADSTDKYSAYRTYETVDTTKDKTLTVNDANGTTSTVTFSSSVSAKAITTEVAAKGHTAVKYTTPADCKHGAFTFWYCTNENCSLDAVSSVDWKDMTINGAKIEDNAKNEIERHFRTVDKNYNPLKVIPNAKGTEWSVATKDYINDNKKTEQITVNGKTVNKQVQAVDENNHVVWTENKENSKAATCMATGLEAGTCCCGKAVSVVLDKLGHDYKVTTKATCSVKGTKTCQRSGCSSTEDIAKLGKGAAVTGILTYAQHTAKLEAECHKGEENNRSISQYKAATCTTPAIMKWTCTCGNTWYYYNDGTVSHTKPEKIDKGTAGGYVLKKSNDGTKVEAYPEPESYKFVATATIKKGTTVKDGAFTAQITANTAITTENANGNAIAALKTLTDAQLAALNIKRVRTPAKSAAYFCTTCYEFVASTTANGTINGKTYIDGHEVTSATEGKTATHGETGYKANSYKCATCDAYGATTAYIDAKGNSTVIDNRHILTKVAAVEPTCTTDGNYAYYTCSGCKTLFKDQYGMESYASKSETVKDALHHKAAVAIGGHSDNDCSTADYVFYRCMEVTKKDSKGNATAYCGAEYIGNYVAAKEHVLVDVAAKAATCETAGNTAYKKCKNCSYTEGYEVVPATGHKDAKGVFYDCNKKGRICQNKYCDNYKNGTSYNTNVAGRAAPTANDDHKTVTETIPATCTTDGCTVVTCSTCGELLSVTVGAKALGHEMVQKDTDKDKNVYVAPTSLTEGRATFVCTHTWTENGKTVSCDYTEVRTLPKKSDLELNISVDNAVVKGAEIVESGKVKVTVSLSAMHAEVWGANFVVGYDADILSFVGAKDISDNFIVTGNAQTAVKTENKKNVTYETGEVWVLVEAENDAEGNAQNITIEGSEALVDIYFTVVGDTKYENDKLKASDLKFVKASAGDKDSKTVEINKDATASAAVKYIADVDGNKEVNVNDLSALLKLMRSEKYSAAADLDKDGEITAIDYALLANYLSGFASMKDIRNATAE